MKRYTIVALLAVAMLFGASALPEEAGATGGRFVFRGRAAHPRVVFRGRGVQPPVVFVQPRGFVQPFGFGPHCAPGGFGASGFFYGF